MILEIVQIIEDEPLHAQLLDRSLRKARYRTNVAGDGVTGLADVKRLNPSLVLLDLQIFVDCFFVDFSGNGSHVSTVA